MSEPDDSHDLGALHRRLEAARTRLDHMPLSSHPAVGPVDPATGESWHRGNVLGHTSEMLGYWTDQIRRANAGSGIVGRDQAGASQRRKGIDKGGAAAEVELKRSIDEEVGRVLELLDAMSAEDLERKVVYHTRDGDRDARVGELVQLLIVVHVEDHLEQLASLG
jgi:DinB superfamily